MFLIKKIKLYIVGVISGLLNGLFGAGGGLLLVPMLEHLGVEPKKAHATSVAIILPLSVLSALFYYLSGVQTDLKDTLFYIIFGLIGAFLGSILLKNIKNKYLKQIFAIIMIISAVRILLK